MWWLCDVVMGGGVKDLGEYALVFERTTVHVHVHTCTCTCMYVYVHVVHVHVAGYMYVSISGVHGLSSFAFRACQR